MAFSLRYLRNPQKAAPTPISRRRPSPILRPRITGRLFVELAVRSLADDPIPAAGVEARVEVMEEVGEEVDKGDNDDDNDVDDGSEDEEEDESESGR